MFPINKSPWKLCFCVGPLCGDCSHAIVWLWLIGQNGIKCYEQLYGLYKFDVDSSAYPQIPFHYVQWVEMNVQASFRHFEGSKMSYPTKHVINIEILCENDQTENKETEEIPPYIISKNRCEKHIFNKPDLIFLRGLQNRPWRHDHLQMTSWKMAEISRLSRTYISLPNIVSVK